MTAEEERRGRRLHFSCLWKNEKERERHSRDVNAVSPWLLNEPENNIILDDRGQGCLEMAAKVGTKPENICLAVTPATFAPLLGELANEEETNTSPPVQVKKALCCFEGCNNKIWAGGVCSTSQEEIVLLR